MMPKVNTNSWEEFVVGELFNIHPTKAYKCNNSELMDEGPFPVVVNSAYNNGIGGYTTKKPTEKGNMITFSDTVDANTIFYQENEFVGYPHVQGLYPIKYCDKWNKNNLLFFASCFKANALSKGFDFGNKFRRDIASKMKVLLPVTLNKEPNFEFMENYINNYIPKAKANLVNSMKKINSNKHIIDISQWKKFHLYDNLFDIDMGTKLDKKNMQTNNPSVNFVGRANTNNGITTCVDIIKDIKPYDAGYLTLALGGEYLGSCFIQPKPFYTSQNVIVLIPKQEMSDNVKRFIATVIFRESRCHYKAFVDELNRHIKTDFEIPLPVTPAGELDYAYMENYMSNLSKTIKPIQLN